MRRSAGRGPGGLGRRRRELWRGCTFPCPGKVELGKAGGRRWPGKDHLTTKGKKKKKEEMQMQGEKYYFRSHQVRDHISPAVGVIFTEFLKESCLSPISRVFLWKEKAKTQRRDDFESALTTGSES